MTAVAWFLPCVALSLAISFVTAPAVARRLGTGTFVAWLLVLSLGVILSATLTPIQAPFDGPAAADRSCDLSRIGPAPLSKLLAVGDTSLNVLLLVPLGWAVGLIPGTRARLILVMLVLVLPFGIEAIQLWAPVLARGCESADVVDNLTGALLGLAGATIFRWLRPTGGSARDPDQPG